MYFLKLAHKDSNLGNAGVRVQCLTAWRWAIMMLFTLNK